MEKEAKTIWTMLVFENRLSEAKCKDTTSRPVEVGIPLNGRGQAVAHCELVYRPNIPSDKLG